MGKIISKVKLPPTNHVFDLVFPNTARQKKEISELTSKITGLNTQLSERTEDNDKLKTEMIRQADMLKNLKQTSETSEELRTSHIAGLNALLLERTEDNAKLKIEISRQADTLKNLQQAAETSEELQTANLRQKKELSELTSQIAGLNALLLERTEDNDKLKTEMIRQVDMLKNVQQTAETFEELKTLTANLRQQQLVEVVNRNSHPVAIGAAGEEMVLTCLSRAFPNNTGIWRTGSNHCGDIILRLENTDKHIMIEVKDSKNRSVSSVNNGKELEKFFQDLHNPSSEVAIHGGVLIALSGAVDSNCPPLEPRFSQSKPYMYVDCLRTQYSDPICLLKVVINMMSYLVRTSEVPGHGSSAVLKLETYLEMVNPLVRTYQKIYRSNETEKKNLEILRSDIDNIKNVLLNDQKEGEENR